MKKLICILCALALLVGMLPAVVAAETMTAGGWLESIYAEIPGVTDSQVTAVSYSGTMSGSLTGDDFTYLVRDVDGSVRIDIPGLKAGTYSLSVTAGGKVHTADNIQVAAHDRSGYAHWNYTGGVGAYNDDGTLKTNAKVLYVTDANKETVKLSTADGKTSVTGIGNILNSGGASDNGNNDILYKLAQEGTPLVVRFVGNVGKPAGTTVGGSTAYGGNTDDNGGMVRMKNGKDITLEGIGADAVINGWGFHFICSVKGYGRSFEARNITFCNVPEDCLGMEGNGDSMGTPVERCWVHNCAFYGPTGIPDFSKDQDKGRGDGACDFKRGQYYTMSYCYFEGYHKTNLVGASDTCQQYNITWHHIYWKDCDARGPLGRQANMHIYNCIYEGQKEYCMSLRGNCYVFSEYNHFLNCKYPVKLDQSSNSSEPVGACKSWQDTFTGCSGDNKSVKVTSKTQTVSNTNKYSDFDTNSSRSYIPSGDYLLDTDLDTAKARIDAYAGPMKPADGVVTPPPAPTPAPTPSPAPTTGTYTLTGDQVFALMGTAQKPSSFTLGGDSKNPDSYYANSAASHTAGTDDFFTLLYDAKSRIDPSQTSFEGGYEPNYRINFQGAVSTTQNAVKFTTGDACTVKVWWVGAVAASEITDTKQPRPMTVLDSSGKEVAVSKTVADNTTATVSTFSLEKAGTYYLGGKGGKNFIYKVEVTVGEESATPSPTPSASASASPSPSQSASPTPSASASVSPSPSPSQSASPTPSASASASPSPSQSASPTPSASASASPSQSVTTSPAPSASATPSASPSASPSAKPSTKPVISGGGGGGGGGGSVSTPATPSPTPTDTPTSTTLPFVDVAENAWYHDTVAKAFAMGLMKGTDATHFTPAQNTSRAMIATILFRLDGEKETNIKTAFDDVAAGAWYTEAVEWAANAGVVKGYDEDTFAPDDNITREQLAVMLYRYAKPGKRVAGDATLSDFADAASVSDWAAEAMEWAVKSGIITGKGANNLDPQGLATRAEAVTMLMRFVALDK